MKSGRFRIMCADGLHLRPSAKLSELALRYRSKITFEFEEGTASAKSVLSILGAGVRDGEEIILHCEGEDEEEAFAALARLLDQDLDRAEI